jgi:hypothetical protein
VKADTIFRLEGFPLKVMYGIEANQPENFNYTKDEWIRDYTYRPTFLDQSKPEDSRLSLSLETCKSAGLMSWQL